MISGTSHVYSSPEEQGQVFLVIILIMVVSFTVLLSFMSRSVYVVKSGADEVDSTRAFSAAESGIEQALQSGNGLSNQNPNSGTLNIGTPMIKSVQVLQAGGTDEFALNSVLRQDDGSDVWLSDYTVGGGAQQYNNPITGTLHIFWGSHADPCQDAALQLIVISNKAAPQVSYLGFDACASRRAGNNLQPNSATGLALKSSMYHASITVTQGLFIKIVPLYTDASVRVVLRDQFNNPLALPIQGRDITSIGTSGQSARKISYFQGYETVPMEFMYSIFAPK